MSPLWQRRLRPLTGIALLLMGVLVAAPAQATVTCTLSGSTLEVELDTNGDVASVARSGDAIQVNGSDCDGAPTVTNTDSIVGTDTSAGGGTQLHVDLSGGDLAPGLSAEPGGISEIEISFDPGTAELDEDAVFISGGPENDTITVGTKSIGLNDDGDGDLDVVGQQDVQRRVDAAGGDDIVSGQGGPATGEPLGIGVEIVGGAGDDSLIGGDGDDLLEGSGGRDYIAGAPGDDVERGGPGGDYMDQSDEIDGADEIDGGPGSDHVNYHGRGLPTAMSANGVADDGVGDEGDNLISIEEFGACDDDDVVSGSDANEIFLARGGEDQLDAGGGKDKARGGAESDKVRGGGGNDDLRGQGAADRIFGEDGDDTLEGGDGRDVINGGPGRDTCIVPKGEKDRLISCERVITSRHR